MKADEPRLRVGLVVGDFPVLSETFVINIAAGLVERGHDVEILAMSGQRDPEPDMHDVVGDLGLARRVHRPALGRVLIGSFGREDDDTIRPWGAARRGAAFAAQAAMFARRPAFDVVHCQFATLGLQVMRHLTVGTLRTRALVVHVRGRDVTSFPRVHGEDAFRRTFGRADLVIANCEHFRQRALTLGAVPDRSIVIGSALDTGRFTPGDRTPRPGGPHLIAIGRLVEKKGFEDAIRGAASARRDLPHLTLEIIGDGPLLPSLSALIRELGAGDAIRLSGPLPHADVVRRLAVSDLLIAPSVTARSGDQDAPVNTLKEAMAMELPVIATRHGGIPELVVDGEMGRLVHERDPDGIAAAIRDLDGQRARWQEMGRRGRRAVLETYDKDIVMARLIEAYREILMQGKLAS